MQPILLLIVLIFLNATFASAEIAVLSMNETRLKRMAEEGNSRAKRLFSLTRQPARFLATIQVAITLAGTLFVTLQGEQTGGHEEIREPGSGHVRDLVLGFPDLCSAGMAADRVHQPDSKTDGLKP